MTTTFTKQKLPREEMVRIVLEAPGTVSMAEIARRCGISRQAARMIRHGQLHPQVLPHLPRTQPGRGYIRCWDCKMAAKHRVNRERMRWERSEGRDDDVPRFWCSLGFPESQDPTYARECPVFDPRC